MIEQASFYDYISVGPQGELLKHVVNGQAMLDYRVKLLFDEDPRWIRLEATKSGTPNAPKFVQLISVTAINCLTIGPDAVEATPAPAAKRAYTKAASVPTAEKYEST